MAPSTVTSEDKYTIHWNGSCILEQMYGPNGQDVLQLAKREIWDYFTWGFVYVTFNPVALAGQYGLPWQGIWKFRMNVAEPSVPSLYSSDGFRESIHRREYASLQKYLAVGESCSISLPQIPNWKTEELNYFEVSANSTQVDVSSALLEGSYHYADLGQVYDYSYWRPYNQTMVVTNHWMQPLSLNVYFAVDVFKCISSTVTDGGMEFTLDQAVFDRGVDSSCYTLDIVTTIPLNSSVLRIPNGTKAEDLHRIITQGEVDEYYTLEAVYQTYRVSFNPYQAWNVLQYAAYGSWHLNPRLIHDIALTDFEPCRTVINQNCSTRINMTAVNQGDFIETFNVTVFANSSMIGIQTVTLGPGQQANLTFVWNTTGLARGKYALLAVAAPCQNETNTEDNNATCYIQVSIKGDLDANGKVNIVDVTVAATAFGARPEDQRWNSNADVNEDGIINIVDVTIIATEFGKTS
jgi:hypothetical protein